MKESLQQTSELTQQQTLSPLQLQFSRALEMTGPEFEEEVRRELDENPALEVDPDDIAAPGGAEPHGAADDDSFPFSESASQMQQADYRTDSDDAPAWLNAVSTRHGGDSSAVSAVDLAGDTESDTLFDYLRSQLAERRLSPRQLALGEYLLGEIDGNGYLERTPARIANDLTFNVGIEVNADELEEILAIVRELDPPGVGAATLEECLMLQLRRMDQEDPTVRDAIAIVGEHFDLFARKHFDRLGAAAGIGSERAAKAVDLIRSLNPKPGSAYGLPAAAEKMSQISPDFEVEPDNDGGLILTMNNSIPALRISQSFDIDNMRDPRRRPAAGGASESELAFIRRKRDEAADFIKAAAMRRQTLWNVASAMLRFQKRFFATGNPGDMRPMILKDLAAMTGYDLSVISRATAGKYIATPFGIYPLKYFFNERPKEELDASTHEILEVLREIIGSEDKSHPLSDQAIAGLLAERGYDIARRTVTKYRERLGEPVARLRREL